MQHPTENAVVVTYGAHYGYILIDGENPVIQKVWRNSQGHRAYIDLDKVDNKTKAKLLEQAKETTQ